MRKTYSKEQKPLVSIIMPAYNSASFLPDSIKSILNQTYRNFELIIIDDFSKDNSLAIIKNFASKYPDKIKVVELKRNYNHGGDSCANQGIIKAKGKYIARMDADDIAYPKRIEKQVDFLEKNFSVFAVGSQADIINKQGEITGIKKVPTEYKNLFREYFNIHPIIHPTLMFRNEHKGSKFYKIKFSANNDYYTLFYLLTKGKIIVNLKEKLIKYRIHGKNDTFVNIREKLWNTIKIKVEMVLKHGYQPSWAQLLNLLFQIIIAIVVPEKIIFISYLYFKGIKKFSNPFSFHKLSLIK